MDFFKRTLAPVIDEAWQQIEEEAGRALRANLSARAIVDVRGPMGLDYSAVNLGRLHLPDIQSIPGIEFGMRRTLPLVELRCRFELPIWELDNIARGARDVDLDPVTLAAETVARFEETAIYEGFEPAGMVGIASAHRHEPVRLSRNAEEYPDAVARALIVLEDHGVDGPYAMVLGSTPFRILEAATGSYPPMKRVVDIVGGPVHRAPFIEGGYLVSTRGGDLELTLGQDVTVGYEAHDTRTVKLFLTETFAFRVLEDNVVIPFVLGP